MARPSGPRAVRPHKTKRVCTVNASARRNQAGSDFDNETHSTTNLAVPAQIGDWGGDESVPCHRLGLGAVPLLHLRSTCTLARLFQPSKLNA